MKYYNESTNDFDYVTYLNVCFSPNHVPAYSFVLSIFDSLSFVNFGLVPNVLFLLLIIETEHVHRSCLAVRYCFLNFLSVYLFSI